MENNMQTLPSGHITITEGVAVFDDLAKLDAAVAELESAAFNRHQISVLGTSSLIDDPAHPERTQASNLAEDPDAPRTVLVMPEEKALGIAVLVGGGAYAGAVSSLLASTYFGNLPYTFVALFGALAGAALGGIVAKVVKNKFQNDIDRQMQRGGLVLWVRIFNPQRWDIARAIMQRHGGQYVHLHEIAA